MTAVCIILFIVLFSFQMETGSEEDFEEVIPTFHCFIAIFTFVCLIVLLFIVYKKHKENNLQKYNQINKKENINNHVNAKVILVFD